MKVLSERTQKFYSLELSEEQVQSIVIALGITTESERTIDGRSFYNLPNFQDVGDELFNSLGKLTSLSPKIEGKNSF